MKTEKSLYNPQRTIRPYEVESMFIKISWAPIPACNGHYIQVRVTCILVGANVNGVFSSEV